MIRILTETPEEYNEMKEFQNHLGNRQLHLEVLEPQHCHAVVLWSIEDIRQYVQKNATSDELESALSSIEETIREDMIQRGWDTIDTLKDDMKAAIAAERKLKKIKTVNNIA